MRVPKQCPNVIRSLDVQAVDTGNGSVAPASFLNILKSVGTNALKGALSGVAGGL